MITRTIGRNGPNKFLSYLLLPYAFICAIMIWTGWPHVFIAWEGDHTRYANTFILGSVAILFSIVYIWWMYRQREYYKQHRKDLLSALLLFGAFYLLPVIGIVILASITEGFKSNPNENGNNLQIFEQWQNIRFYIFLALAIAAVIVWTRKDKIDGEAQPATP